MCVSSSLKERIIWWGSGRKHTIPTFFYTYFGFCLFISILNTHTHMYTPQHTFLLWYSGSIYIYNWMTMLMMMTITETTCCVYIWFYIIFMLLSLHVWMAYKYHTCVPTHTHNMKTWGCLRSLEVGWLNN